MGVILAHDKWQTVLHVETLEKEKEGAIHVVAQLLQQLMGQELITDIRSVEYIEMKKIQLIRKE